MSERSHPGGEPGHLGGEAKRALIATAVGLAFGLVARLFLRKDGGRAWRGKSAS